MESAVLQLAFLGGMSVRRGDQPLVDLTSYKARALLCYLSVTGHTHLRPALAGLLWGNQPESNALMNLRKALKQLRRHVGAHLLVNRRELAFNHGLPHRIDAITLQAAADRIEDPGALEPGQLKQVEQAIALYRGDFLEGFHVRAAPEFEQWVLGQRTHFRELVLRLMLAAAAAHTARGQYDTAIDFIRRLLRLEPWHESGHRHLMHLLAYLGQRGAALAQYETCRHALKEELGVEPSAETRTLCRSIETDRFQSRAAPPLYPVRTR